MQTGVQALAPTDRGGELTVRFSKAEIEEIETALDERLRMVRERFPLTRLPRRIELLMAKLAKAREDYLECNRLKANAKGRARRQVSPP